MSRGTRSHFLILNLTNGIVKLLITGTADMTAPWSWWLENAITLSSNSYLLTSYCLNWGSWGKYRNCLATWFCHPRPSHVILICMRFTWNDGNGLACWVLLVSKNVRKLKIMLPPFLTFFNPSKIERATAFLSRLMMHSQCLDAGPPLAFVCVSPLS